ncbi:MAG: M28 family peptidase [Candidatus Kapabacteria bacterium]|nr:M28 family peptidase [Candidatus Kapabacteria bacterium]
MLNTSKLITAIQIAILLVTFFSLNTLYATKELSPVAERILEDIKFLSSDSLQGRYPGTIGIQQAADYIKASFEKSGLLPVNGQWFQEFQVTTALKVGTKSEVSFDIRVEKPGVPMELIKPQNIKWELNKDWVPLSFSDNGNFKGELAFVGYGISSKELKYDDYEGIDVKDKIVIVLTSSPEGESSKSAFMNFNGLRYKATNARDHGAKGIIFLKTQGDSSNVFIPLEFDSMGRNSGIAAIQANRVSIARFFPKTALLLPVESEINKKKHPKSFMINNSSVNINTELLNDDKPTYNVLALVKGSDPVLADDFIVIGAHYDHLGWGGPSSQYKGKPAMIHNGADDNASGTSGVMELARRISRQPLKRSVLFICFSGEEMGLLGSAYFTNHSPIPLEKITSMINLDMIGRMKDNSVNVFGIGTGSYFQNLLDSLAISDSIKIIKAADGFAPTDHSSFYAKNLPVLFLFTGIHADYHRPSDDWDKINAEGENTVLKLTEDIVRSIGNRTNNPTFIKVMTADSSNKDIKDKGYGAWLGIIPNFEENPYGCKISGSSAGSPAMKAGLKDNDIIIKIGSKDIKNLYDLTFQLREHKPGDIVPITLLRGKDYKEKVTVDVTLSKKK